MIGNDVIFYVTGRREGVAVSEEVFNRDLIYDFGRVSETNLFFVALPVITVIINVIRPSHSVATRFELHKQNRNQNLITEIDFKISDCVFLLI
tara:strand:- start:1757 stop:2035 length:279 start_codon:yes stop_codon:yes gene_type:complete